VPHTYSTAIVLGASMSGLLTARALSEHFERVFVVERDVLPTDALSRKGTPQASHGHGLLSGGYKVLNDYFPGMMDDLALTGARSGDVVGDLVWFQYGRWKTRQSFGIPGMSVSRLRLEAAIRARVKALGNISFIEGASAVKPVFDSAARAVTGIVVQRREQAQQDTIDADLVVDTTGRGSHSPQWLEDMGYTRPEEQTININIGYATREFERKPGELFDALAAIIATTPPQGTRYAAIFGVEDNRWIVTLGGTVGDFPPADEAGWNEFASTLPVDAVHQLVTTAKPLSEIMNFRFPASQRRHYERMRDFPSGYLVLGDAICSFNPIYGQGMSVAAMEAKALDICLKKGMKRLSRRFFRQASRIIDTPWTIVTGEDFRFPQVDSPRPMGFRIVNRYLDRVHAVASFDPVVCKRFFMVANLLARPASLMTPGIIWRVLSYSLPKGAGSPFQRVAPVAASQA
jgi:2-polyprenyl-6-methoxyphenol hydroxylase-like FAD-dependent oxidoreductase